jgi:DNA-directed RNA polymerase specialized sigma24 family protein
MEKEKKKKAKDEFYVNPELFKKEIEIYYQTGDCTNYLGDCLNKIAEGLGYNPKFINYSYKEDMIGDALIKMFSALKRKKFDIKSDTSPFGYFTTIAFHAFINRIKKEKKYHDTLVEYRDRKYEEILSVSEGHVYVKPIIDSQYEDPFSDSYEE